MSNFKRATLLLTFAWAIGCLAAHANLGDTPDQCIARLGQPIERVIDDPSPVGKGDKIYAFRKNGLIVVATIFNGTVGAETIWKENKSVIQDAEISGILDGDSAPGKWFRWKDVETGKSEAFLRDDKAMATYNLQTYVLNLYSADYYAAAQSQK